MRPPPPPLPTSRLSVKAYVVCGTVALSVVVLLVLALSSSKKASGTASRLRPDRELADALSKSGRLKVFIRMSSTVGEVRRLHKPYVFTDGEYGPKLACLWEFEEAAAVGPFLRECADRLEPRSERHVRGRYVLEILDSFTDSDRRKAFVQTFEDWRE